MGSNATTRRERVGLGSRLGQAWRRLTSTTEELDSSDLQTASKEAGAQPILTCGDRDKVCLSGTVASVRIAPSSEHPRLIVELRDGSGSVTLVWMGRRTIPGVDSGRTMKVHGRISCHEGQRVMYNPRYELICSPSR
ncbi:OB-fold nucleic acid binding domain-containing protein [Propionibacteriaceae bacterium Y1685]|uniref:OB-fold nucleic acid binding domain-containing protein n=1 Tax=Microlunatus sp. Y1700 TaxID=3418487 RepID=UPI003B79D7B8